MGARSGNPGRFLTLLVLAVAGSCSPVFADEVIRIPRRDDMLSPVLSAIALELLAYHLALHRGHDIDQPRNLAKSVTVE